MTRQSDDLADAELRLCEALAAYFEAMQAGEAPNREVFLAGYPDLADELAGFLEQQERLLRLTEPLRAALEPMILPGSPSANGNGAAHDFGDYELLEQIAHGGMGAVYRARQRSLNRLVALKLLQGGAFADREDARRFRLEAEAVAQLDHPNIVPIYEVGEHDGQSFFSMKLIEGGGPNQPTLTPPIDPRAAARLVATVARAIHHAHQRGVLHRDLKPSNILIDLAGQPYVTDFGLAKRLEGDLDLTQSGAILGTPSYMAPEQASGKKNAVTVATDVYGLGAVLYALLSGKPPFQGDSVLETLDQVRQKNPDPPSSVGQKLDRDLETICLKCLAKEPERRYPSAEALAEDLERWLRGEPIAATPPSTWYHFHKFARRNRVALTATTVVALSLVVGTVVSVWQAIRAREAAGRAIEAEVRATRDRDAALEAQRLAEEQADMTVAVSSFFLKDLLGQADLANQPGRPDPDIKVRALLDRAAEKVSASLSDRPIVEAGIRGTIGASYAALGLLAQAEPHLKQSFELRSRALGSDHFDTLLSQNNLACLYLTQGKLKEAEPLLNAVLDARRRLFNTDDVETLTCQNNLAGLYLHQGRFAEAEPLLLNTLEGLLKVLGIDASLTLRSQNNLAALYQRQGRLAEAEPLLRAILAARLRTPGPEHPETLLSQNNLGVTLRDLGKLSEAEALLLSTLESQLRGHGPEHPDTLATQHNLARVYQIQGRLDEAESLFKDGLNVARLALGAQHPVTMKLQENLRKLQEQSGTDQSANPLQ